MTYIDPRDGNQYRTVKLRDGNRWLAENLRFETEGSFPADAQPSEQVLATNPDYDSAKYGRLYTWEAAQQATPPGWHVPTDREWKRLFRAYGGYASDIHAPEPAANDVPSLVLQMEVEFGGCLRVPHTGKAVTPSHCYTYFGNFMGARFWSSSRPNPLAPLAGWDAWRHSGIYYLIRPNPATGPNPRSSPSAHRSQEVLDYAFSVRCISD